MSDEAPDLIGAISYPVLVSYVMCDGAQYAVHMDGEGRFRTKIGEHKFSEVVTMNLEDHVKRVRTEARKLATPLSIRFMTPDGEAAVGTCYQVHSRNYEPQIRWADSGETSTGDVQHPLDPTTDRAELKRLISERWEAERRLQGFLNDNALRINDRKMSSLNMAIREVRKTTE